MPPVATGVLSFSGHDRSLVCLSVFFLFLLVISAVVMPACRCVGTVVSWIVCPSLSVGSPVDACIDCVRLSFVNLLGCLHRHLWTVVLSASIYRMSVSYVC